MYSYLKPPVFPDDEEKTQTARALHVMLWLIVVATTLMLLAFIIFQPIYRPWRIILNIGFNYIGSLVAFMLNKRGFPRLAGLLIFLMLFVVTVLSALTAGGLRAPATLYFFLFIFSVGLLLGARAGVISAILCIAAALGLTMLESWNLLPEPLVRHTPYSYWAIFSVLIVVMAGLQSLADVTIKDAVKASKKELAERKQAEDKLRRSEEKYRTILESTQEGYFEVDLAGNFTFFNDSMCRFLGYSKEEMMGMNNRQFTDKEHSKELFQTFNKVYSTGEPTEGVDWQIIRKNGDKRHIEASVSLQKDSSGKPVGFKGMVRDITERQRMEEKVRESEKQYRTFFSTSRDCVFITSIDGRWIDMNDAAVELFGYSSRDELMQVSIPDLYVRKEDRTKFINNLMEKGSSKDYPIDMRRKDGAVINTLLTSNLRYDANDKATELMGTIKDVTERKKAEETLHQTLDRLKKAFGTTIQVLVSAIEMRDPYTAGHQKNSADVAIAIAMEMGLPQEKIDGILMAAIIHDIGKLSIPAEILSKPTKLTNIEFSLIKEHSHSGYEMLKDVESPWPLAEIVYQHHERMNGSGYPKNLKGDEILVESRILAVADVVEAMASHRPYRAALGIEAALEEIEKNKGILYDCAVADACLKLFREKGYLLK